MVERYKKDMLTGDMLTGDGRIVPLSGTLG